MVYKYKYKKPYRIKKRKSILKSRFFWLAVLFLTIILGISYFLFFSAVFKVEKIIISGNEKVSKEQIESPVQLNNIFFTDIGKIEKDILNKFPQIANVKIHRQFPNAISIAVAERMAVAKWCQQEECFLIDNYGVLFERVPKEADLLEFAGQKELLNKESIAQVLEIKEKLKNSLGITTTQALIATEERLNIKTSESFDIYFNLKGDLDWQITELSLVLEKQILPAKRKNLEYIDLRFSRVFYK